MVTVTVAVYLNHRLILLFCWILRIFPLLNVSDVYAVYSFFGSFKLCILCAMCMLCEEDHLIKWFSCSFRHGSELECNVQSTLHKWKKILWLTFFYSHTLIFQRTVSFEIHFFFTRPRYTLHHWKPFASFDNILPQWLNIRFAPYVLLLCVFATIVTSDEVRGVYSFFLVFFICHTLAAFFLIVRFFWNIRLLNSVCRGETYPKKIIWNKCGTYKT